MSSPTLYPEGNTTDTAILPRMDDPSVTGVTIAAFNTFLSDEEPPVDWARRRRIAVMCASVVAIATGLVLLSLGWVSLTSIGRLAKLGASMFL